MTQDVAHTAAASSRKEVSMQLSVPRTVVELQPCRAVLTLENNVDRRLGPLTVIKDGAA